MSSWKNYRITCWTTWTVLYPLIKKHTLLEEVFDKDNNNSTGGTNAYYTIILKNDKKRYHSDKEGGLVRELNDYFKEILEF